MAFSRLLHDKMDSDSTKWLEFCLFMKVICPLQGERPHIELKLHTPGLTVSQDMIHSSLLSDV